MAITLRGAGLDTRRNHHAAIAVFTLSEEPDSIWIGYFRKRARYSVFDAAGARFQRNRVEIPLPRREDLGELIQSVERFIEGANLDIEFMSPQ